MMVEIKTSLGSTGETYNIDLVKRFHHRMVEGRHNEKTIYSYYPTRTYEVPLLRLYTGIYKDEKPVFDVNFDLAARCLEMISRTAREHRCVGIVPVQKQAVFTNQQLFFTNSIQVTDVESVQFRKKRRCHNTVMTAGTMCPICQLRTLNVNREIIWNEDLG